MSKNDTYSRIFSDWKRPEEVLIQSERLGSIEGNDCDSVVHIVDVITISDDEAELLIQNWWVLSDIGFWYFFPAMVRASRDDASLMFDLYNILTTIEHASVDPCFDSSHMEFFFESFERFFSVFTMFSDDMVERLHGLACLSVE